MTLLNYCESVLTVSVEDDQSSRGWLVIISTANDRWRLITRRVDSSYRTFVANDSRHLYFGTHSDVGSHGHHEWAVHRINLTGETGPNYESNVRLENLVGYDIGSNVAFTIHNGYFYALSNQTSFELEEIDYTSFYTCMRFPLDNPFQEELQVIDDIYRRQNSEGAINDSWTDLSFQVDERTGELMIIEARREYLGNTSAHQRTYYIHPVPFPTTSSHEDSLPLRSPQLPGSSAPVTRYPANDVYIPLITPDDKPRYTRPRPRIPHEAHPEYGSGGGSDGGADDREDPGGQSFVLWKTKFRTYNLSSSSFLDLVEDEDITADGASTPCLRLRGGSRRLTTPLEEDGKLRQPDVDPDTGTVIEGSEARYKYSKVRLWPPRVGDVQGAKEEEETQAKTEDAEFRLPYGNVVHAAADERTLVYSITDPMGSGGDKIVLVNFDPGIRIGKDIGDLSQTGRFSDVETKGKGKMVGGRGNIMMWKEEAQYLSLN